MSVHELTKNKIITILQQSFSPNSLEVFDDSHAHKGHREALLQPSAGHFRVIMTSSMFEGQSMIQRHRMVYKALEDLMKHEIHALSLKLDN